MSAMNRRRFLETTAAAGLASLHATRGTTASADDDPLTEPIGEGTEDRDGKQHPEKWCRQDGPDLSQGEVVRRRDLAADRRQAEVGHREGRLAENGCDQHDPFLVASVGAHRRIVSGCVDSLRDAFPRPVFVFLRRRHLVYAKEYSH